MTYPWSAGEVLTASALNDEFASKVDYALPTNAQTGTTYTFVAADAEKLTTASNAAAVTLTIPPQSSVTWGDDTVLRVVNYGAGAVTIDGGSGVTVTNTATTVAQYGAAVAIRTGSDAWTVVPFGGGDVPAAEVSSPAATGQYTDTGITYDYYTFTSSGTLTVDTAGFADVLVVGGGGAGGAADASGGGAGGHLYVTDVYLSAATHTVTVGGGGAGVATNASEGQNGSVGATSSLAAFLYSPGGGGGTGRNYAPSSVNRYSTAGISGGSGGGSSAYNTGIAATGGAGISGLGSAGGQGNNASSGGGGGGANAVGGNASSGTGGAGGAGLANSITGASVTRAGGGGGRGGTTGGAGGAGGGGAGASGNGNGTSGSANTGGGGGGGGNTASNVGGNGGSGVVIVRVKV